MKAIDLNLSRLEKFRLMYIFFFPVIFLPIISIYLLNKGDDPKGFFLTNVLISVVVILIPLSNAVCGYAAKFLHNIQSRDLERASLMIGILCFLFNIGCNYYLYYKFVSHSIEISSLNMAIAMAILFSTFIASIHFSFKYLVGSKFISAPLNTKMRNLVIILMFPVGLTVSVYFLN